jgi:hypothetical protein
MHQEKSGNPAKLSITKRNRSQNECILKGVTRLYTDEATSDQVNNARLSSMKFGDEMRQAVIDEQRGMTGNFFMICVLLPGASLVGCTKARGVGAGLG